MIVVRVELHSAITGQVTELARMILANTGAGTAAIADYTATTLRGRCTAALNLLRPQRRGTVHAYPRQRLHVWNLVTEALTGMGYGRRPGAPAPQHETEAAHG